MFPMIEEGGRPALPPCLPWREDVRCTGSVSAKEGRGGNRGAKEPGALFLHKRCGWRLGCWVKIRGRTCCARSFTVLLYHCTTMTARVRMSARAIVTRTPR